MKNSNDIIGNRTRDLPVYSTVPQPNASQLVTVGRKYCEAAAILATLPLKYDVSTGDLKGLKI
jgi:hypothetical protein